MRYYLKGQHIILPPETVSELLQKKIRKAAHLIYDAAIKGLKALGLK